MLVDDARIADLPKPLARALHRAGVVGRPVPTAVTVHQVGRIRSAPDARWMQFTAEESYEVAEPGFVWIAALKAGPVTVGRAVDSLREGRGRMHVKLLGMITVVDESGPEMDRATLMRWFNETMWFPAAWVTDAFTWQPIDDRSVAGTVSAWGTTQTAELRFDDDGRLVDFVADRERHVDGGFELTTWRTPVTDHRVFDGIEVPTRGTGVWELADGDFEYVDIEVTEVRFSYSAIL